MAVKNLAKIAKKSVVSKPTVDKGVPTPKPKEKVEKKLSLEEERQLKIRETVDSLLQNVDLTNPNDVKEPEVKSEPTTVQRENTEWLEEQIEQLNAENLRLSNELAEVKQAYDDMYNNMQNFAQTGQIPQALVGEGQIKQTLINEYRLIQSNMIQMGVAQQPIQRIINVGEPLLQIHCLQFIQRLEQLFPFLINDRQY